MADTESREYQAGMLVREGYGLTRKQRDDAFWYEHLRSCKRCWNEWYAIWEEIPESQKTSKLAELVQRNHLENNK